MIPKIGQTYKVRHSRKGTFIMRIDRMDDTWAHGQLIKGTANAMLPENVIHEGEPITIRIEHAIFSEP